MKPVGPWYSDIAVMEKLDGLRSGVVITTKDLGGGTFARDYGSAEAYVHAVRPLDPEGRQSEVLKSEVGFTAWVKENAGWLFKALGIGSWQGVWWGEGIGRDYGREGRAFALYAPEILTPDTLTRFDHLVDDMAHAPVLYYGPMKPENGQDPVGEALRRLQFAGSAASRGFKSPAGVIVANLEAKVNFSVDL